MVLGGVPPISRCDESNLVGIKKKIEQSDVSQHESDEGVLRRVAEAMEES
jgi:hypothetical protein